MIQVGKLSFLGTGASMGVPMLGCLCEVCRSKSPYNKRLRTSGFLEVLGKKILLDVGPDFRTQALRQGIEGLDGLILTHTHYDHIGGFDELRVFNLWQGASMLCLLSRESLTEIEKRYYYMFRRPANGGNYTAQFKFQVLEEDRGDVSFCDLPFKYFSYYQGPMKVNGYRLGDLAYVTDIRKYPEEIFQDLSGVETLVLSALRYGPSHIHFSLDEAVAFSHQVGAKRVFLIHLGHELDHSRVNTYLPDHINCAYDGLQVDFFLDDGC